MAEYEQMEFDVRLESDRDLQENVNLAIDFACKQVQHERPKTIENRHEASQNQSLSKEKERMNNDKRSSSGK